MGGFIGQYSVQFPLGKAGLINAKGFSQILFIKDIIISVIPLFPGLEITYKLSVLIGQLLAFNIVMGGY